MKKNWNLWRFYSLLKYKIKKHENDKVILEVEIEKSEVKTELNKTCNDLSYRLKSRFFGKVKYLAIYWRCI